MVKLTLPLPCEVGLSDSRTALGLLLVTVTVKFVAVLALSPTVATYSRFAPTVIAGMFREPTTVPVPLSGTSCGLPLTLSFNCKVADCVPLPVGVNVTAIVLEFPAAIVIGSPAL